MTTTKLYDSKEVIMDDLTHFVSTHSNAIRILYEENNGDYLMPIMAITFKLIDNFSYLEYGEAPYKTSKRFKDWCDAYLMKHLDGKNNNAILTSSDLWQARCSLLHNGTSESSHKNQSINVYSDANITFSKESKLPTMKVINVHSLNISLHDAILDCLQLNDVNNVVDFFNRTENMLNKKILFRKVECE